MNIYEKRIEIAKQSVKKIRLKTEYGFKITVPSIIVTSPKEWAFGVIGILDFILTGDPEKILLHEVIQEVKKLCEVNK